MIKNIFLLSVLLFIYSCGNNKKNKSSDKKNLMENTYSKGKYGYDLQFLQSHIKLIELVEGDARVIIAPEYQGRVMTSSSSGLKGFSYGWINHELIEKNELQEHINPYGGEERLWFGPEGGQFSIFFKNGEPFDYEHWQTPACLDTEPFFVINNDSKSVLFKQDMCLHNYTGTKLQLNVSRKVSLISKQETEKIADIELPASIQMVAYQTANKIENTGDNKWTKQTGTLSIWLLGMMNPSPDVTIIIPYKKGDYGKIVTSDYFGEIPENRLKIDDSVIYLKADGKYRSKIGVPPLRVMPCIGSYDSVNKILTVLKCTVDSSATDYVNSAWEIQDEPFAGDVINAYNDGPLEDGSQMGPFYELETSSKAAFLKPGETLTHTQTTMHFEGSEEELDAISRKVFGVSIKQVKSIFR